jgi:cell shape-determining protein MreC
MSGVFSSRAMLASENAQLETQIIALTPKAAAFEILKQENAHLQALLNMPLSNDGRAARIITTGKASPYGTFMIDGGADTGIAVGDIVLIEGGFVVGTITSANARTALVSELFASGNSLDVLIGSTHVSVIGQGGGNASAQVPRGASAQEGDVAVALLYGGAPVGVVGKVVSDPASAYSVLYLRTPINIDAVKYVYVRPPPTQ